MGLQGVIRWFLPREERFYDLMEHQAVLIHEAARVLERFKPGEAKAGELLPIIEEYEHKADALLHQMEEDLAQTFVTPLDREDIHRLSSRLDDIMDLIKATAQTYVLYNVREPSAAMTKQMDFLVQATQLLGEIVPDLRKHAYARIIEANRKIFQVEKEADAVFRSAVRELFHNPTMDAKDLLREKEVLEDLEQALNKCEAAADVLSNLAVKHG